MADRKKKRAYLDDFEKDLNGNYQYRGAHYHYKGTKSRGREPLRAYIHEQTVLKLPGSCTLAAVLAGITAAAQLVQLAVSRQNLPARILFILLQAAAAGAFAMENHQFKALKYEKQE